MNFCFIVIGVIEICICDCECSINFVLELLGYYFELVLIFLFVGGVGLFID